MNPLRNFQINKYKQILEDIEKIGDLAYLRELENKVIQEIVRLIEEGSDEAKKELLELEKLINDDLGFTPRNHLLIAALKKSITGALSIAKLQLF